MRHYSVRSCLLSLMALAVSAFMSVLPASAAVPIDVGKDVLRLHSPNDIAKNVVETLRAIEVLVIQRQDATVFVDCKPDLKRADSGDRTPFALKPEYAESLDTHGLIFIDVHLRC